MPFNYELHPNNQAENMNRLPELFLSKLTVRSMVHCGRTEDHPFVVDLHPHFNSIIGGRGSGKSTLIEAIRIVARRDRDLTTEAPRVKEEFDKFMCISQEKGVMQNDTEILLELHRRGEIFLLRWRMDGKGAVLEELTDRGWQEIDAGDIRGRFPVSIFSQKQINELASNPKGLLEVVDRTPDVDRAEWKSRWESTKSHFFQLRERKRELSRQLDEEQSLRTKLRDTENDLKLFEEGGHGTILKEYQKLNRQKNGIPSKLGFDDLNAALRKLAADAEAFDFSLEFFEDDDEATSEIRSIQDEAAQEMHTISESLTQLAEKVENVKARRADRIQTSQWNTALQANITAYNDMVNSYEEKQDSLSITAYGEWVEQAAQLRQQLNGLDDIRKEAETVETQITDALQKLLDLRKELFDRRHNFLDRVIGSSAFVRMELVPFGEMSILEDEYRSLLGLHDIAPNALGGRDNRRGILSPLLSWSESGTPATDLPKLIETLKSETFKVAEGKAEGESLFVSRLKKLLENQPAAFDRLDAWWPEDMLRVKYSKNPASGKFEDLEKGSAGQKAAAILAFLLSHGNEPLVMDQPEDDLDNALIYDLIVQQIHENKNRRQLVVATHNPNIVVNGNSELVHVLKFENGEVQMTRQGMLDDNDIRDSICTILEGGRQAFDMRYRRITSGV